jgi:phosphatidate cytidylyltransferase
MMASGLSKYNDLTQRVIAGVFGAIAIIAAVLMGEWTYFAAFMVICFLTQVEFYRLLRLDDMLPLLSWGTFSGLTIYIIVFLVQAEIIANKYYFVILPVLYIAFLIKLYRKIDDKPFTNIGLTFLGIIYVAMPFSFLHVIAYHPGEYTYQVVLGIIFIQWASDSGAYFAGIKFGRRKLFERVSPKKSWEGFLGGTILAIVVSLILSNYFGILESWQWVGIAIIVAIVGTYGDLVESLFKRSMEIKDSSAAIPGHGGFLDRFDSLLMSLPYIALFLKIF